MEKPLDDARRVGRWTRVVWSIAAFLFALPLIGMQVSKEMDWDETDFIVFGGMLLLAAGTCELAARSSASIAFRAAVGIAVAAGFILIWMNLAVGIIGSEDNPANLMFGAVLAVGVVGAFVARFRSRGMARALVATAAAQVSVGIIALLWELGTTGENWPRDVIVLTLFFTATWLGSAWLFAKSARPG